MGELHDLMESNDAVNLFVHILHFHRKLIFSRKDVLNPLVGEPVKRVYIMRQGEEWLLFLFEDLWDGLQGLAEVVAVGFEIFLADVRGIIEEINVVPKELVLLLVDKRLSAHSIDDSH